jgi:MFS transporter, PPP family, 3-phenylpropionic acid transporter
MAALPLRLALFYAAVFVVFGVRLPFWPPWLAARGLTAQEISLTLALTQWASVAAAPLAGIAADRRGDARRIMPLLSFGTVIGLFLCLPAKTTLSLSLLGVITGALFGALTPLGDNVTLAAAYAGKLDYGACDFADRRASFLRPCSLACCLTTIGANSRSTA